MNKLVSAMHDATHLVPGVPGHSDTPATHRPHVNPHAHNQGARLQNHSRQHQNPPRVLVNWQAWISRLVGRKNSRHG